MALCRLVFPLLVLSVVNASHVLVYLWGDVPSSSVKPSPLSPWADFDGLLTKELHADPITLVFIEKTLSVEDFSRKNAEGDSSFPYLQSNLGDAVYLPSVNDPVPVLKKLAGEQNIEHLKYTEEGLSGEIIAEKGKFIFIDLEDAKEGDSRSELLRRHDDFMRDTFAELQKSNSVVAVYTAYYPAWTSSESHLRTRRQASNTGTDHALDGLRIDMDYIKVMSNNETVNLTQLTSATSEISNNVTISTMNTTLMYNNDKVVLNFKQLSGYWYFETVTLTLASQGVTEDLYPENEVFALMGFAYRCAQEVTFTSRNDTIKYTLAFEDLKIQPFFEVTNNTEFGDSFNCVGFFSAPIWAALFVVFIFLAITFYGIIMMMDIRTMDRFDDPKGKTITINASD